MLFGLKGKQPNLVENISKGNKGMETKLKKEPKPILSAIMIKDTETNAIICSFAPTRTGERYAERFKGLAGIEIIKEYTSGGELI